MSSLFSQPKVRPQEIKTEPVIIDNSKKTREMEQGRKKRRGAAMSFIAGNTSLSGNQVRKNTLGE